MTPAQILIVQLGRIGDFILATAMFSALKAAYPHCQIHVLASRHNAALACAHPLLDRVHVHSKKILATLKLLAAFKRERYDYWIDPKDHYSREGSFFARRANAERKIGFNHESHARVFDISLPSQEAQHTHAALRNLHALRTLRVEHADPRPNLFVDQNAENKLAQFLNAQQAQKYFCVNLSAGNPIRYWPQSNWRACLNALAWPDRSFVLIADAKDRHLAEAMQTLVARTYYFPTHTISDMLAVVQRAELVISPDTSVVHVAAAFDRPLLGLYSNHEWNYKKFYPLSTHCRVVIPPAPGALIKDIQIAAVLQSFEALMREIEAPEKLETTQQG